MSTQATPPSPTAEAHNSSQTENDSDANLARDEFGVDSDHEGSGDGRSPNEDAPSSMQSNLVKRIDEYLETFLTHWGFVIYLVRSPTEDLIEEIQDEIWARRGGGQRIWGKLKFEWVELAEGEGVEEARSHLRNLVSTDTLPDFAFDQTVFLVDHVSLLSILSTAKGEPKAKRVKCDPESPPYIIAVDPNYRVPDEDGEEPSYEGEDEGYDGIAKIHFDLFLSDFWVKNWTSGCDLTLDELLLRTLDAPGGVYNGD